MYRCPKCNGCGNNYFDEDDKRVESPCYCCSNTGKINETRMESFRWQVMYESIAVQMTQNAEQRIDDNDEGFAFHAAESGMTIRQYRDYHNHRNVKKALEAMSTLDHSVKVALLDLLSPKLDAEVPPPVVQVKTVVVDDAPF
jgi:hypothetical protein